MIARLRGALIDADGNRGIVDVSGVGYEVFAPKNALVSWQNEEQIDVHVCTQVREDAITLYGFPSGTERQTFVTLIGVKGVGPKMALAALDTLSPQALAEAIARDDVLALNKIPGVGKRTAQRLALELKGKLVTSFVPTQAARTAVKKDDPLPLALARLGYTKSEIDRAKAGLEQQGVAADEDTSIRLQAALRILSGQG